MYSYLEPTRGGKEWKKMNFDDIVAKVKECGKKTVAVSVAQDSAVLEAVHEAKRLGIADAILVGDEAKIREIAAGLNMDLSDYEIINEPDMIEASLKAVKLAHDGRADMYMKGLIDSKNFLKSVLNKEVGLRTGGTLSHVCVFEIPGIDRLLFLTDVAFMTYPTLEEKVQIIKNTIPVCNACGVAEPKVAPLAAVEVVNPKMPVTVDAAELTKMCEEGQIPGCIVDGQIKQHLDQGDIVICSVRQGDFTTGGHFILLYDYDDEGFSINDPFSLYRSGQKWDYGKIRSQIKAVWALKAK